MADAKKRCFVIGPIGAEGSVERRHADMLLHFVIKEVLEKPEHNYTVHRADGDAIPGVIGDRLVNEVTGSELCVADLTGLNPNVFYELGIRHSIEKPVIHIAASGTKLPFDNAPHHTIFVDIGDWTSIERARAALSASAKAVAAKDFKVSNPVTQANDEDDYLEPSREWEPIALDRENQKLQTAISRLDDTISDVRASNGYASEYQEERNYVVDSLSSAVRRLKGEATVSISYLREFAFRPLGILIRRFGKSALGILGTAAKDAIVDWLKDILELVPQLFE